MFIVLDFRYSINHITIFDDEFIDLTRLLKT